MVLQEIRLAGIVEESITDGPGIRFTIFTQGCEHNCYGCHNPQTHDINGGYMKNINELVESINDTKYLKGVTFSGGEPFLQAYACHLIASRIKKEYDIISYTGYTFEKLLELSKVYEGINLFLRDIDYLIDGQFIISKRSLELRFKGSSNQRIIDVKKSLVEDKVILANF